MKITWGRNARADLAAIEDFIGAQNPKAASGVIQDIVKSARLLLSFPKLGLPSDEPNIRLLQVSGRPYLLPYRVIGDEIEILAVFDERQERPDQWS